MKFYLMKMNRKKDIQRDMGYFTQYGKLLNNDVTWVVDRINRSSISDEQKKELTNEYNLFWQKTNYDRLIGVKGLCDELENFEHGVSRLDLNEVNKLVKKSIVFYYDNFKDGFKDDPLAIRLIFIIKKVQSKIFETISGLFAYSLNSSDYSPILEIIQNSSIHKKLQTKLKEKNTIDF